MVRHKGSKPVRWLDVGGDDLRPAATPPMRGANYHVGARRPRLELVVVVVDDGSNRSATAMQPTAIPQRCNQQQYLSDKTVIHPTAIRPTVVHRSSSHLVPEMSALHTPFEKFCLNYKGATRRLR